jgi:transposase InsO family protein
LLSLPLKHIIANGPFQQWGLDFIGEIHPPSSGKHKWILTATDYFTKWIEAIPTRNATDKVIMRFLEGNIFSRFGCPRKLITDNAQAFKSASMVAFCKKYNIKLAHSTPYYPHGNGLVESSNKSLVRIIKKLLEENKRSWDSMLKFSLWADRINTKKSIGTSPFQLVYGTYAIFPTQLGLPILKFLQEELEEPNDIQRRIFQIIEVQQRREMLNEKFEAHQSKVKVVFDKNTKKYDFETGDLVLRWDARREEKFKTW